MSTFGALTSIGPIIPLILNGIYDKQTGNILQNLNYFEKAIRESQLKQYIDDPETKDYFEFDGWDSHETSIWEIQNQSAFNFREVFIVKSNDDLGKEYEKLESSVSNSDIINGLNYFYQNGIKLDNKDGIKLKNDINISNVKKIYNKLKLNSQPLYLTSYVEKDHKNINLFEKDSKLEKIWKIINSNTGSFYDHSSDQLLNHHNLGVDCFYDSCRSFDQKLEEMVEAGEIGVNYKKRGFVNLPGLHINNPQYYGFLYFIEKLKNIATSFWISASMNGQSNGEELNLKFEAINKHLKAFSLNNYLNLWSQWYMMWQGDFRPIGSDAGYSMFLIPNFKANFAISNKTRTFLKKQDRWNDNTLPKEVEVKENFITVDPLSVKPITSITGLNAGYLCISLILAITTIYITIRKDFV